MTRARKVDPAELEREYVYDPAPRPISITELAEKYGLARSGVAEKCLQGGWVAKRDAFRTTVGMKVTEVLTDSWVAYAAAQQEKMISAAVKTLEVYERRLDEGEIKPTTRDAVAMMAALRVLINDRLANAPAEASPLDPTEIELSPEALAAFITSAKRGEIRVLESGGEDDGLDFTDTGTP